MTASDVERRLADLLRDRAEEAMEQTDTQEQLTLLVNEGERDHRRRRRTRYVAGAAAVAAAVVALAFIGTGDDERADVPPADHVPTESEIVASRFLTAVFEGDVRATVGLLPADARPGEVDREAWTAEAAWNGVNGSSLVAHTCLESGTTAAGTPVACEYTRHGLASEEWGLGPYAGTFVVTVRDGEVSEASDEFPFATNGYNQEVWSPFASFVAERSLRHAKAMYVDLTYTAARTDDRALRLWERYVAAFAREAAKP